MLILHALLFQLYLFQNSLITQRPQLPYKAH